ncbi:Transcriptional regulator, LysR family [Alkalibacterium sp. AK22]|uniref:LysR family transcriptional regulator n=1 Tax=Alkalibacterium sp. AK22 TaxID=1229520 RepID=UPI00044728A9|nr:LysR family transcriptional regulator [Alkalibacterium sp. AK22]EXJ23022.1 Transcriptional regulator, LysR family [Alkalibacterium sp. AK22]
MDIKQLSYFVAIVEADFNMSQASKYLHLSQPALSQTISNLERNENVQLFERSHGRLQNLTAAGEILFAHAKDIISKYELMMEDLQEESSQLKGNLKIGIPPVVISVVFPEILPKLLSENPKIGFEIKEAGAVELKKGLLLQELPIAVLLKPTELDSESVEEVQLSRDTLSAFMSKDHPLALKDKLEWADLHNEKMALFDSTYMIHHQLQKKFASLQIKPQLSLQSASWDLLLNATRNSSLITILPTPVAKYYSMTDVIRKEFVHPLYWEVVLCRRKQKRYSRVENYVFNYMRDYYALDSQLQARVGSAKS